MVIRADMTERRDFYRGPTTGEDTALTLNNAITTLAALRGMALGDAGDELHLLMSLLEEAKTQVPRAVADGRNQEYSWAEIADLLGVTRASAWQRYAGRTEQNRTPLEAD